MIAKVLRLPISSLSSTIAYLLSPAKREMIPDHACQTS
jgi:hypothetical protein